MIRSARGGTRLIRPGRRLALGLGCLYLAVFALYLHTLSPAFHPDDSAETQACAATVSVQHPPGYPLPTLLGRLAVVLGPGPVPFDVNLLAASLGALCAVEAAGLLYVLAGEFAPWAAQAGTRAAFALAGGAVLAAVGGPWSQATIAKGGIYTLNLALTLGILLAALSSRDEGLTRPEGAPGPAADPRALGLAALLLGLGLAAHWPSQVAVVPGCALVLAEPGFRRGVRTAPRAWAGLAWRLALPLLAGLALYLVVPLRSGAAVPLGWGDPRSLAGLAALVARRQYAAAEAGKTLGSFFAVLGREARDLAADWTWPGLAALAGGWALLLRRRPWLACGLLLVPLGLGLAVAAGSKPPADSVWVVDPYLLPLEAGLGLGLAGWFAVPRARRFLPGLLVLGALGLALRQWPRCDRRDDTLGWDYARNLLASAPAGCVVLAVDDAAAACPLVPRLLYRERPDVTVLAAGLCDEPWYRERAFRADPGLRWPARALGPYGDMAWMARAEPGRPFAWSVGPLPAPADPGALRPRGLLLLAAGSPAPTGDPWPAFALRGIRRGWATADPLTRRLVLERYADAAWLAARWAEARGRDAEAVRDYVRAGILAPGRDEPWLKGGALLWRGGDARGAEGLWKRAAREAPGDAAAWADLGLAQWRRGARDPALASALRALADAPGSPEALGLLRALGATKGGRP